MIAKLRHIDFNQQPVKIEVYSVTQEQPHYHQDNVLEILLCLDGSVDIRSYFMKFRKDSGDITSFDYMDIHTAKSHGQNLLVSYYFDLAHPAFGKISERFHFFDCDKTDSTSFAKLKELRQLLLIILAINTMPDDLMDHREKQIKQESVACKIIKLMEDSFISIGVDLDFSEYPDALKERFGQLLLYIDNHQQERLTIKQLGDVIHVNPDYLSQLFRQIITGGFRQYMYMMKLYWAHFTLLTNDSVNLFDLAMDAGFSSTKIFYREFKYHVLTTPHQHVMEYRRYAAQCQPNRYFTENLTELLYNKVLLYLINNYS